MSINQRAKDMGVSDLVKRLEKLEEENKNLTEENDKLKSDLDRFSEAYKKYRDYEKEELAESCYDFARENKKLKEDVEYFRQIYLDLKKMCEDDGYLLTDEEVTKLFNLDEIK